jgi:hypothetical protein
MNPSSNSTNFGGWRAGAMAVLAASGVALAGCASLPDDGKDAKVMRFDGLRAMRYCEVFLIGGDAITKDLDANFYNTTDLNNAANPRDTCPTAMWAKVDTEALKKQYDVLGVFKNGPRGWANDWIELPTGVERSFDGLRARWMGNVALPKDFGKGSVAYIPVTVSRKSKMGFSKGQPVFMLMSPDGMPWVMQAYSNIVDPNLTYADLQNLGSKLKLAPGWKYQVKVIDRDLEIHAIDGKARIVQDELENTYDACFQEAGQSACTFKP